ncbi:hypothetical protein ACHAW5_011029, partial [Stephanodiscus triporus]
ALLTTQIAAAPPTFRLPPRLRPFLGGRRLCSAPTATHANEEDGRNRGEEDDDDDDDGHCGREPGRTHLLRWRRRSEGGDDGRTTTTRTGRTSTAARPPPPSSSSSPSYYSPSSHSRGPYMTSPYFRRIFASGMRNLEERRREADGDVDDVEGALRSCFGINEDMARVIADAAAAVVASMEGGGIPPGGGAGGLDVSTTTVTTTTRHGGGVERPRSRRKCGGRRPLRPPTPSISADDDDRRRRIRDRLLSPVDLSGYSRRRGTDGMLGGRHDDGDDNTPRSPTTTMTRTTPVESSKSAYAAARHGSEFFASVARGRGRVDETKSVGRLLLPSFSGPDDE